MSHTGSFVFRSLVALALMVGFYVLAFTMAGGLLYIPYATVVYANQFSIKLTIICIVTAFAILKGCVFVRTPVFEAPGPAISEPDQPELFRLIREIAGQMKTRMPDTVYLIPDVNAFVSEVGGFFGFGSHRVMGIGIGLLHVDNVSQVRATIAHEFGHYAGGDTRIGGLVYRTRAAIVSVVENLSRSWISKPFVWYANLFMWVSHGVSREQELAADRAAIRLAGKDAHLTGLECEARGGILFNSFVRSEVVPLLQLGFCTSNLFEGFALYHAEVRTKGAVEEIDAILARQETSRYDTHPALPERLAYGRSVESSAVAVDGRPAIGLLKNTERLEQEVSSYCLGRLARGKSLEPVAWQDVAAKVYAPRLAESARDLSERLSRSFGGEGKPAAALRKLGEKLDREGPVAVARTLEPQLAEAPSSTQEALAPKIVANAVGVLMGSILVARGGTWRSELGKAHQVMVGETLHEPFVLATEVVGKPKDLLCWIDAN